MARRKIKKKDLKKPDEFIAFSTRVIRWCQDNRRAVLSSAVALLLLALLVAGIFQYRGKQEEKAQNLYRQALALFPTGSISGSQAAGQYAAAIARLQQLQKDYGSTAVATTALVDLGNAYFQSGAYEKAVACYKDFLRRAGRQHPLRDQVLESLGTALEAKGSWQAALEVYQRLLREGAPAYRAEAHFCLGRVYENLHQRAKAAGHYRSYLQQEPGTIFSQWVRVKLSRWRLSPPTEKEG